MSPLTSFSRTLCLSWFLASVYEVESQLSISEIRHWGFDEFAVNLSTALVSVINLNKDGSVRNHEHAMSFHFPHRVLVFGVQVVLLSWDLFLSILLFSRPLQMELFS